MIEVHCTVRAEAMLPEQAETIGRKLSQACQAAFKNAPYRIDWKIQARVAEVRSDSGLIIKP